MNRSIFNFLPLRATCLAAVVLLSGTAQAAMTKAEYNAARSQADGAYKAETDGCKSLSNNAKDICKLQAKGHLSVAKAEAEYAYSGKPDDMRKLTQSKINAAYDVERERCDDLAGNGKDVCVMTAKATREKALADLKLGKTVAAARTDAADAKRDADYKVAAEKCDALSSDAKTACINAAKAQYGKS